MWHYNTYNDTIKKNYDSFCFKAASDWAVHQDPSHPDLTAVFPDSTSSFYQFGFGLSCVFLYVCGGTKICWLNTWLIDWLIDWCLFQLFRRRNEARNRLYGAVQLLSWKGVGGGQSWWCLPKQTKRQIKYDKLLFFSSSNSLLAAHFDYLSNLSSSLML